MKSQATAKLNSLRIAPKKVRLVVDDIRGKSVADALRVLTASKKGAARPVKKLLESCVANAMTNHKMNREGLQIVTIMVDGGAFLKRWMPRAMGRATPIRKRSSHITLVIEGDVQAPVETEKKKTAKKEDRVSPEASAEAQGSAKAEVATEKKTAKAASAKATASEAKPAAKKKAAPKKAKAVSKKAAATTEDSVSDTK